MQRHTVRLLAACLGMGVLAGAAHAFTVTKNGKAAATIVISEEASATQPFDPTPGQGGSEASKIRLAADDLQAYIQKISGAKLPLVSDAQEVTGPVILVGASTRTAQIKDLAIPSGLTAERNEDGYLLFCKGNTLVLAGNDAGPYFGTHYAVAEFLHRLGVRWIMPSAFGDIVPSTPTIAFEDVRFADKPSFRLRTWWCNQPAAMSKIEALWKIRNKMQIAAEQVVGIPGDSQLRKYMPDAALMETQPELFGRHLDQTLNPYMPNLSNPEAARLVAEKVIAEIREAEAQGKPMHALGFAPDDGWPIDQTPQTANEMSQGFTDWVGREGLPTERSISEEWFTFMSRVCEHVVKVYPDVIITSNGYANRSIPPEGVMLHPNMGVMYACIWADTIKPFFHPKSWHSQVQAMEVKRWGELCSRVFLYNYNLTMLVTLQTPIPQVRKMAVNYPLYRKWGIIGFFNESKQPYMEEGLVTRYMRTRLMWNANLDVDAALNDYFGKWYGPAAAPAAAFWKAIEDCLLDSPLLGHEDRILPYVYTKELLTELERHVAEAERLADSEAVKTRVRIDRLTLEHLQAYMAMRAAEFDARYGDAADQLGRMADLRMQLNAISPFIAMPPAMTGVERYHSGEHYYGVLQRKALFEKLRDMTNGKTGDLVVLAPKTARFTLDEAGMGKDVRWHEPGFDRSGWRGIDTTKPYYMQGYLSDIGVPYAGKMWYVFELDVPASAAGKAIRLYAPIVTCEAWTWVNGEYAGKRNYLDAYYRPAPLDLDVTALVKPGEKNTIAVWVGTGVNRSQAPDGFMGRLFLWSPNGKADVNQ